MAAPSSAHINSSTKAIHEVVVQTLASGRGEDALDASKPYTNWAYPFPVPPRQYCPALLPRPNCTHIVMDYLYTTDIPCDTCGLPPRLGWLFVCRQDWHSEAAARRQIVMLNRTHEQGQSPSRIDELQACGMSCSILKQIKQGNVFDRFQVEVLKNQKINMLRVMEQQLAGEDGPWHRTGSQVKHRKAKAQDQEEYPPSKNVSVHDVQITTANLIQKLGHFRKRSQVIPKCGFKCCSTCRPYLKDRAYISLGAAVIGDVDTERFVPQERPVSTKRTVETLGLRPVYYPRFRTMQESSDDFSTSTSYTTSSDDGASEYEVPSTHSPATPAQMTRQNSVAQTLDGTTSGTLKMIQKWLTQNSVEEPAVQLPSSSSSLKPDNTPVRSNNGTEESHYGLFNHFRHKKTPKQLLWRSKSSISVGRGVRRPPLRNAGSHQMLDSLRHHEVSSTETADDHAENPPVMPTSRVMMTKVKLLAQSASDEHIHTNVLSDSVGGHVSPQSGACQASASSNEVFVHGGVALTEEAVETKIPDIITQV
ncbi:uncharacterized protein PV09_05106 [Verruconis gallopava]|uniref:Uncharacterized protein n=1 Tax=Verruconis gallopava TaxID=253628 RepID=A0A0D1XMN0_9PEZI|nr:uncharacterized protein PV09_05106 [Verruconis gallopava]KIW03806.1 hypothetical protein PV09_05106 [Verruconis gallopava]